MTSSQRVDQLRDPLRLIRIADLDGDLADRVLAPDRDRDDVADQPLPLGDRPTDARELPRPVRDLDPVGAVEHGATLRVRRRLGVGTRHSFCSGPYPPSPWIHGTDPRTPDRSSSTSGWSRSTLGDRAPADRPYTIANFVSSADGRATFEGRSGALGDDGDKAVFHGLREQVDAVLAGTRTLQAEHYGRIIGKPERRARREARGLPAEPLALSCHASGAIPVDIPLFNEPAARIVVFAPAGAAPAVATCTSAVTVVELEPDALTLPNVMRALRSDFAVRSLLCEGGPTVFTALVRERLVDELWLDARRRSSPAEEAAPR